MSTNPITPTPRQLSVIAIHGERRLDAFFHAADVFETSKAFAQVTHYETDLTPDACQATVLTGLRDALEKSGQRVVAVFVSLDPIGAWRDESVKSISNGTKWAALHHVLDAHGYREQLVSTPALT